jgi:hypothetical protein
MVNVHMKWVIGVSIVTIFISLALELQHAREEIEFVKKARNDETRLYEADLQTYKQAIVQSTNQAGCSCGKDNELNQSSLLSFYCGPTYWICKRADSIRMNEEK